MLVGDILEETRLLEGAKEVGFAELCSGHGVAVELSLSGSSTDNVMKGAADVTVAGVLECRWLRLDSSISHDI